MISQTSRKIVVASAMAAVVGIGVVIFALRSHPVTRVAQTPIPPASVTQTPAATLRAAEIPAAPPAIPDVPAVVAQVPDAPAAVAHHDSVSTNSSDTAAPPAVWRKLARKQHLAKADTSAVTTDGTVKSTGSAADTGEKPAAETVDNSVDRVKSADELAPQPPPASGSAVDAPKAGTTTEFAAPDSQVPPK